MPTLLKVCGDWMNEPLRAFDAIIKAEIASINEETHKRLDADIRNAKAKAKRQAEKEDVPLTRDQQATVNQRIKEELTKAADLDTQSVVTLDSGKTTANAAWSILQRTAE